MADLLGRARAACAERGDPVPVHLDPVLPLIQVTELKTFDKDCRFAEVEKHVRGLVAAAPP